MPLDHYVSQVHLKNFYSPKLGDLMHAIRKSDLKSFTPNAKAVCRIEHGNTNSYLREDRAVEEFLTGIEPKYNTALAKLAANNVDSECIYVVAGFVAYILACSPAGMRIQSEPLKGVVEETAQTLDSQGGFPSPPPELGGESLADLLHSGKVRMEIDPKYPQALGIASILSRTITFGNFKWEILNNPFEDSPFFTSDFPVAIEKTEDFRVLNRIVPLAPSLAIRIRPDLSLDRERSDFSFSSFRHTARKLTRPEVMNINRLIVRCAETTVFFRDDYDWAPPFVKKNAAFRIEPRTQKIPHGNGTLLWFTQEVCETNK
ncbi:MAG: DUF4238 domain-containing protein [Thiobacillus sp.]|jgi:hypothetical protein|nr:DUF4238 domain-containing protein [Thiobacillus sp.]